MWPKLEPELLFFLSLYPAVLPNLPNRLMEYPEITPPTLLMTLCCHVDLPLNEFLHLRTFLQGFFFNNWSLSPRIHEEGYFGIVRNWRMHLYPTSFAILDLSFIEHFVSSLPLLKILSFFCFISIDIDVYKTLWFSVPLSSHISPTNIPYCMPCNTKVYNKLKFSANITVFVL